MNRDKLYKNITEYIFDKEDYLDPNEFDFSNFSITNFDFRKLFQEDSYVTNKDLSLKFFETVKPYYLNATYQWFEQFIRDDQTRWKVAYIFFMVIPFTEYEFLDSSGSIINPYNLNHPSVSVAAENILIGTFSEIKFKDNSEMALSKFENNLKSILNTNLFSEDEFTIDQKETIVDSLLRLGFVNRHRYVTDMYREEESTYRDGFKNFLFEPICEFLAALLGMEVKIRERNTVGPTGVQTKVPHQTNDIFHSYPDLCAYLDDELKNSLAIVEVKKLPLLIAQKRLDFEDPKMKSFLVQLLAEMLSNHKNNGILTDSYTSILIEISLEEAINIAHVRAGISKGPKYVPLSYKIVDCQSSGLTLIGALTSFIYEAFKSDKFKEKSKLDKVYNYVRKTDDEYLEYLTRLAIDLKSSYKSHCKERIKALKFCRKRIQLGAFKDIDVQSGFYYNSQIFKVNLSVKNYLTKDENLTEDIHFRELVNLTEDEIVAEDENKGQFIVKVFDPLKFKRDHGATTISRDACIRTCRRAYSSEKIAYEILSKDKRFNSLYVRQNMAFANFCIREHYHAMGPFIIFKYIDPNLNELPIDRETYESAKLQLRIIHANNILHGDIAKRNILYSSSEKKVYLIDFGYSKYHGNEKESRPNGANPEEIKAEHKALCDVFEQAYPTTEEWDVLIRPFRPDEEMEYYP